MTRRVKLCLLGAMSLILTHAVTGVRRAVRWRCGSWRCPDCRPFAAYRDRRRVEATLKTEDAWLYVVLTYRLRGDYTGATAAWNRLRTRLTQKYGKLKYILTWERGRNGFIHANLVITGLRLLAEYETKGWRRFERELGVQAHRAGFGWKTHVSRRGVVRKNYGRVANYVTKTSGTSWDEFDDDEALEGYVSRFGNEGGENFSPEDGEDCVACLGGECEVHLDLKEDYCQLPLDAPPHFRRISSSQGLLPPPEESEERGEVLKEPFEVVEARLAREAQRKSELRKAEEALKANDWRTSPPPPGMSYEDAVHFKQKLERKKLVAELAESFSKLQAKLKLDQNVPVAPPPVTSNTLTPSPTPESGSQKATHLARPFSALEKLLAKPYFLVLAWLEMVTAERTKDSWAVVDDTGSICARWARVGAGLWHRATRWMSLSPGMPTHGEVREGMP